jgi:hypothetical protein
MNVSARRQVNRLALDAHSALQDFAGMEHFAGALRIREPATGQSKGDAKKSRSDRPLH